MKKEETKLLLKPLLQEGQTIFFRDKEYYVKHISNITESKINVTLHEVKRYQ